MTKKLPNRSFLLTFDDGLREFHDVVAPILLEKGIPAVCFLNSGFIDNKDMFFRFKQSLIYNHYKQKKITKTNLLDAMRLIGLQIKSPLGIFKVSYEDKNLLNELAIKTGVNFQEVLNSDKPYMTTDQIRDLSMKGFVFGGHSIDHPEFQSLSSDDQEIQLRTSIEKTIEMTNQKIRLFSFPFTDFGVKSSFFTSIFNAENSMADMTFGCAGLKHDPFHLHIQRIPVEIKNLKIQNVLNAEYCYYMLRSVLNRNMVSH